jgi:hypothetical protein
MNESAVTLTKKKGGSVKSFDQRNVAASQQLGSLAN